VRQVGVLLNELWLDKTSNEYRSFISKYVQRSVENKVLSVVDAQHFDRIHVVEFALQRLMLVRGKRR
jgi:hypothetical protein